MFSAFKFFLSYIFFVFIIAILIFLTRENHEKAEHDKYTTLIKKFYPNSKFLTSGKTQSVHINNNRIIKVYNQTNFNYVKLLRKLEIYPPIYKIIKYHKYYIVEEKYLKPISGIFILEKFTNIIFKKFKISFKDIKLCNFGIDPDTNKIHRLDCNKTDIILKKKKNLIELKFAIYILLTFLLIIFTFIWKIYYTIKSKLN
jgi:hypothetical protein